MRDKTIKDFYEQFEDFSCYVYHGNEQEEGDLKEDEYPAINLFVVSFGDLEGLVQLLYNDIMTYRDRGNYICYEGLEYKGHFKDLPVYVCVCGS